MTVDKAHSDHHPSSKLTSADVIIIRSRQAEGESMAALAREYGVSRSAIWAAVRGYSWKRAEGNRAREMALLRPFKCPVCGASDARSNEPLPLQRADRVKYDFSRLAVGDSITVQLPQNKIWSRLQAWRRVKSEPHRREWGFATRAVGPRSTRVWRTR